MKNLLKEYYLVEFRDGSKGIVVMGNHNKKLIIITDNEEYLEMDNYDDNLLIIGDFIEGYNGDAQLTIVIL